MGNDNAGLVAEGVDGTEDLDSNDGRIDVDLDMWGHPELGVLLVYSKWGGGAKQMYSSKGDLTRLRDWVRSQHGTPLPVGSKRLKASTGAQSSSLQHSLGYNL